MLGVIGLVIGGIWVAASSVRQNMPLPTAASDLTGLMISSGAIPADLLVTEKMAKTPWGTPLYVKYRVLPNKLQVYLQDLPKGICYALVNRLFAHADVNLGLGMQGLDIIYLPSGPVVIGAPQTVISSRCANIVTGSSWIEFQFPAPR